MQQPNLSAGWASDFVNQQPIQVPAQLSAKGSVGTTINSGNVNVQHSIGPVGPRQGIYFIQSKVSHLLMAIPKAQICAGTLASKEMR